MLNKLICALIASLASISVQASVLTFTDRAAFQAAVAGYTVDNLNSLVDGPRSVTDRGAYSINMSSFGCSSGAGQCGDNSPQGFTYPAYLWTYNSGTFTFLAPINAFGIDFGFNGSATPSVTLNGEQYSRANGGFFGILDTAATFTTVSYASLGSGSLLDNVTYGATNQQAVPEPASLALLMIGLSGIGAMRRRPR